MTRAKAYQKRRTKARQRRRRTAAERLQRDLAQAQQAAKILEQALDDLGLPENGVFRPSPQKGIAQGLDAGIS